MGFQSQFVDPYNEQLFGRVTGTFLASRFPSIPARLARLKAYGDNAGSIWIGDSSKTGTFPMPWEMQPGDDTGWFSTPLEGNANDDLGNLNVFYQNASSGSSYIAYWIQR